MRRIFLVIATILFLFVNSAQAELKQGASPLTTGVNTSVTYKNIVFPYNTRDLIVQNNDSTAYVYVDVKNVDNTGNKADCFLLGPGNELALYDYITGGISLLFDNIYSTDTTASPISVLAVY